METMTPEAQQLAIAAAAGWEELHWDWVRFDSGSVRMLFGSNNPKTEWDRRCFEAVPDYLNDLNAMHAVEKTLQGETGYHSVSWARYERELYAICRGKDSFGPYHASSEQRAEASLRTLDLWKP